MRPTLAPPVARSLAAAYLSSDPILVVEAIADAAGRVATLARLAGQHDIADDHDAAARALLGAASCLHARARVVAVVHAEVTS